MSSLCWIVGLELVNPVKIHRHLAKSTFTTTKSNSLGGIALYTNRKILRQKK